MSFVILASKLKKAKINEALIINEILKNSKEIILGNVILKDISDKVHISHSTVSRLIQKAGYKNWNAFVQSCVIEELFSEQKCSTLIEQMNLQRAFLAQWIGKNQSLIKSIIMLIKKSKVNVFFGERISGNIAQNVSFLFGRKGIMCTHYFFENELFGRLQNKTTIFIFTSSGRTDFQNIIDEGQNVGCKFVIIDSSETNIKFDNVEMHVKIPLVSHLSSSNSMHYIKSESIRELFVHIYEMI